MGMKCKICVEVLENGYTIELPDIPAYNKAEAEAKKKKASAGNSYVSTPYMGDFMKEYMAKTVDEVITLLKPALKNLPQTTYNEAFAEAVAMDK